MVGDETVPVPISEDEDSVACTGLPSVLFGKSPVSVVGDDAPPVPVPVTIIPPVPVTPNVNVGVETEAVMFEVAVDEDMGVVFPVPVGPIPSEQEVVLVRGNGGEDAEALGRTIVPIDPVPVGPGNEVLLSKG